MNAILVTDHQVYVVREQFALTFSEVITATANQDLLAIHFVIAKISMNVTDVLDRLVIAEKMRCVLTY
jgi:hypothetical protein